MRCRAADRIDVTAPLAPPLAALAVPDKRLSWLSSIVLVFDDLTRRVPAQSG